MDWLNALWALIVRYWPLVLSLGVPFAAGAIARCSWDKAAKTWTAFGVSLAVGVLGTFVAGMRLTPESVVAFGGSVFVIAQLAYPEFKKRKLTAAWLDKLLEWGSVKPSDAWGT